MNWLPEWFSVSHHLRHYGRRLFQAERGRPPVDDTELWAHVKEHLVARVGLSPADVEEMPVGRLAELVRRDAEHLDPRPGPAADAWPPPDGWHFRPGEAAYNGRPFAVAGTSAKLLRRLVQARGTALSTGDISDTLSPETPVEDKSVRGYVSRLNRILRDALALHPGCRPVRCVDGAYRLDLTRCTRNSAL